MRATRLRLLAVTCLCALGLGACGGPERASDPPPPQPESEGSAPPPQTAPATCMPGGLESATEVEIVRLPIGCSYGQGGSFEAPRVISDPAGLASSITCPSGTAAPTVDFSSSDVLLVTFSMSPAYGGMGIFDDGTTVTFVQRDRPPCPGDPMPMPMSSAVAFRLPHGATRAFRQASCSLPPRCG